MVIASRHVTHRTAGVRFFLKHVRVSRLGDAFVSMQASRLGDAFVSMQASRLGDAFVSMQASRF